jgi:hypothetical protein
MAATTSSISHSLNSSTRSFHLFYNLPQRVFYAEQVRHVGSTVNFCAPVAAFVLK